jgi:hypothetical protein
MQEYVKVKVESTGVETVIPKELYAKYPADFIHLGAYVSPETLKVSVKRKTTKTEG